MIPSRSSSRISCRRSTHSTNGCSAGREKIEKESGGRLKFEIYPNGQLVGPPNRQFDAARNGITDIAWCLHGVTPGRYPMTELGQSAVHLALAGCRSARDGKAHDGACAEISRGRTPGPAHSFHEHGQPGRDLQQDPDQDARRLQGQEDPLRLDHEQVFAGSAWRGAVAGAAAGSAGRAGQGRRRRRGLSARSGLCLRPRLGLAEFESTRRSRRPPSRW